MQSDMAGLDVMEVEWILFFSEAVTSDHRTAGSSVRFVADAGL